MMFAACPVVIVSFSCELRASHLHWCSNLRPVSYIYSKRPASPQERRICDGTAVQCRLMVFLHLSRFVLIRDKFQRFCDCRHSPTSHPVSPVHHYPCPPGVSVRVKVAERLINGPGRGWASRVFYTDNGSTATEVGIKMGFRWGARVERLWLRPSR